MKFKIWLEQDIDVKNSIYHAPPNSISIPPANQIAKYKQTVPTDTLLAVDEQVERLQQIITHLIFRKKFEGTDTIQANWQNFLKSWRDMKFEMSQKNIPQDGLGSYVVPPGQEAMMRTQQPPPMPNTSGWTASGGLNV